MTHAYLLQIRRADVDAFGHVNNVVLVDYLDEALGEMLDAVGATWHPAVVSHRISYRTPLGFSIEPVVIGSNVDAVSTSSFTLRQEIERGDTTYVEAITKITATRDGIATALAPIVRAALTRLATVGTQ